MYINRLYISLIQHTWTIYITIYFRSNKVDNFYVFTYTKVIYYHLNRQLSEYLVWTKIAKYGIIDVKCTFKKSINDFSNNEMNDCSHWISLKIQISVMFNHHETNICTIQKNIINHLQSNKEKTACYWKWPGLLNYFQKM